MQEHSKLPIQRARMRLRVTLPISADEQTRQKFVQGADKIEEERSGEEEWQAVSYFRDPETCSDELFRPSLSTRVNSRPSMIFYTRSCKGEAELKP